MQANVHMLGRWMVGIRGPIGPKQILYTAICHRTGPCMHSPFSGAASAIFIWRLIAGLVTFWWQRYLHDDSLAATSWGTCVNGELMKHVTRGREQSTRMLLPPLFKRGLVDSAIICLPTSATGLTTDLYLSICSLFLNKDSRSRNGTDRYITCLRLAMFSLPMSRIHMAVIRPTLALFSTSVDERLLATSHEALHWLALMAYNHYIAALLRTISYRVFAHTTAHTAHLSKPNYLLAYTVRENAALTAAFSHILFPSFDIHLIDKDEAADTAASIWFFYFAKFLLNIVTEDVAAYTVALVVILLVFLVLSLSFIVKDEAAHTAAKLLISQQLSHCVVLLLVCTNFTRPGCRICYVHRFLSCPYLKPNSPPPPRPLQPIPTPIRKTVTPLSDPHQSPEQSPTPYSETLSAATLALYSSSGPPPHQPIPRSVCKEGETIYHPNTPPDPRPLQPVPTPIRKPISPASSILRLLRPLKTSYTGSYRSTPGLNRKKARRNLGHIYRRLRFSDCTSEAFSYGRREAIRQPGSIQEGGFSAFSYYRQFD